jgi:hypothetical protein
MRIVQGGRAGTPVSPLATGASTSALGDAPLLNFATISTSKRMGLWRISGRSNCAKQRKYAENAGILQGLVLLAAPLLVITLWTGCTALILNEIKVHSFD